MVISTFKDKYSVAIIGNLYEITDTRIISNIETGNGKYDVEQNKLFQQWMVNQFGEPYIEHCLSILGNELRSYLGKQKSV